MEPRIQYVQTEDGVNIAYADTGTGMPFVHMPISLSHVQRYWQSPVWRPWFEQLAARHRLVQYDGRGSGLSQRGLEDYSLDDCVSDLEAVVRLYELRWRKEV